MSVAAPTVPEVKIANNGSETIQSISPATGRTLGEVCAASPDTLQGMVSRARSTQQAWYEAGLKHRVAILRELRAALQRNTDLIVDTLVAEQGKPTFEALIEFWTTLELLSFYTRIAQRTLAPRRVLVPLLPHRVHQVEYRPYGVVAVIAPWNFPILLSMTPIIAALLTGNTVIFKPSEFVTQTGEALAKAIYEAGVPRDVFQIVHGWGDVGAALVCAKPDKVSFTGSPSTARKIAAAAAENLTPLTLELGGKDAAIVLEDADLDRAAIGLTWGALFNAGQACLSVERIYVRREIVDPFVQKLTKVIEDEIHLGPGDSSGTTMGAITTEAQLQVIDSQVRQAVEQGARVLTGGCTASTSTGRFYLPTVLADVSPDMPIVTDETFGPVIPIIPVDSDEEALRLANATSFGLTGSVWTRNTKRGLALAGQMRVGHASINDHVMSASAPNVPWGGFGDSGYGRTRGREGLLDMVTTQVVSRERGFTLRREFFWYPYTPLKQKLARRAVNFLYAGSWREKLRALLP